MDDYALMIYDRFNTLPQVEDLDVLYRNIILLPEYAYDPERNERKIVELYHDTITQFGNSVSGIPSFEDVVSAVTGYNGEIMYNISLLELLQSGQYMRKTEREISEMIEEGVIGMEEFYSYNSEYFYLDHYIAEILKYHKLSFFIDEYDEIMDEVCENDFVQDHIYNICNMQNRQINVVAEDCQNILFDDFAFNNFFGYGNNILLLNFQLDNRHRW